MKALRAGLLIASSTIAVACSEHTPRSLEASGPPAAPAARPIGLDARPVGVACQAKPRPTQKATLIAFQTVTTAKLDRPVEIVNHDGFLYILEQGGKVLRLSEDGAASSTVLDVSTKLGATGGGEAGLLGIAFHPQFATNGFVFLYHTVPNPVPPPPATAFQSALVRYHSNDGGLTLDPASEKRIMTVDQPYSNHNGATIAFGNDGLLYWGLGDGGGGGDQDNRAQDLTTLLGKMLRIDVDSSDPYAIPPTNPFAAGGGRAEIYAVGLRNPYRFRFDPVTGDLWAGDVGQGAREEIDKIVLGGNFGWPLKEGKICFRPATGCDGPSLIEPIVDHDRTEATTITGGVVYRGTGVPLLTGKYVYADFNQHTFWTIPINEAAPTALRLDEGLTDEVWASAFAIDKNGEIVLTDYNGLVRRIVPGGKEIPETPELLSETGCIGADPRRPPVGVFPYDVNAPQWIDGTGAERFLSVPALDKPLTTTEDGRLVLPPGSIASKTILDDPAPNGTRARIETQLAIARPGEQGWDFYSYVWNAAQTDATIAREGTTLTLPSGKKHTIVARSECLSCHSLPRTPLIGLEPGQLDRDDVDYGAGRLGNPLATLEALGMTTPVPAGTYAVLARREGFLSPERRARAYLHANCAHCHLGGEGQIDLRYETPLAKMNACNAPGKSKAGGRVRLAPRDPAESQLVRSLQTTSDGRMPPFGSLSVDQAGVDLVASWIATVATCE